MNNVISEQKVLCNFQKPAELLEKVLCDEREIFRHDQDTAALNGIGPVLHCPVIYVFVNIV